MSSLDKVTDCVVKGVDVIFLDLAKAFDKVPHVRLMNKIYTLHIRSWYTRYTGYIISNWIENWLKGRKQRVCIRGAWSAWIEVASGVPQGSVLGPILFLIFINDLECIVRNRVLKFADDTKLFGKVQSEVDYIGIQEDLQIV